MQFRIADTFTDSLERWTGDEQGKIGRKDWEERLGPHQRVFQRVLDNAIRGNQGIFR